MLSVLLWLPLAFGIVALLVPAARAWVPAAVGSVATLALAAVFAIGFDPAQAAFGPSLRAALGEPEA